MTECFVPGLAVGLAAAFSISLCCAAPGLAQTPGQFDKPVSVQTIRPKPEESVEIRCTTFPDLMIRETQDGPESENAVIVREAQPPCTATAGSGETVPDTAGMTFDGRRGRYLLFSDLNPHGATGFVIVEATSGRILLRDSALGNPVLQSLTLDNENLRLRYRRGVNAPCSLLENTRKCWARLIKDGLIPGALKTPSARICRLAYKRDKAPRNNPSIVNYATEVIIDAGGNRNVLSRGVVRCAPMP